MLPQAPWSPTAHAFAQQHVSHVANFWKQGWSASFQMEALPGGQARLNLTFQLPSASEVIPPPSHVFPVPAPQRHINPLFPRGCFSQDSGADSKTTPSPQNCQKAKWQTLAVMGVPPQPPSPLRLPLPEKPQNQLFPPKASLRVNFKHFF